MREFISPFLSLFRQVVVSILDFFNYAKSFLNKKKIKSLKNDVNREISDIARKTKNFYETNTCLGLYHFYRGNINDAKFRFNTLKLLYKDRPLVYYNLARCFLLTDNANKAKELLELAVANADYREARFFLCYINGEKLNSIPSSIIKERFDYLAHNYVNNFLIGKCYIGHKLIFDEVRRFFGRESFNISILDLGCGTGICTHFLKLHHMGSRAIGVDISDNMLAVARNCIAPDNLPIFDEIYNQDIVEFLDEDKEQKYDLIIAGDSFGYIGDLQDIIAKCREILSDNGLIIILVGASNNEGYEFELKRCNFLYSKDYLAKLGEENHLKSVIKKCKYESMFNGLICCYFKKSEDESN